MKILNYGSLNYDYVYSVPHIVARGETITASKMECFLGGKGLNQSVAIKRAGSCVYQAGSIGEDGGRFLEFCKENGICTDYVCAIPNSSGSAFIQVDENSENCIVLHSGANRKQKREHIDRVLKDFAENDIIVLQNEINELPYIIDKAYERNMRIVLNPSPYDEQLKECDLNKIEFFLMNEVEGEQISGSSDPEEMLCHMRDKFPHAKVVLTLGSKGAIYQDANIKICQPAYRVQAVDTTAAGDTFTGYFIHGVARGISIEETLKIASKAAAVAVSKDGATCSIPYAEEVNSFKFAV